MPVARPESSDPRIVAHIDMDCFYVQVEQRKQPELRGLPTAVVQYNEWKGGALIAVSYEARKYGVKRSMRGDEAKQVCPQIHLVQVPVARGKADLNTYRNAGSEVVSVLSTKGRCERASIDEVYLDLTEAAENMLLETPESLEMIDEEAVKSHVLGLNHEEGSDTKENVRRWLCRSNADHRDKLLACGAMIVAELRMQVLKETEFTCSAGIAHNKMLAKLASAMNKPAKQTVVPSSSVEQLLSSFPIKKMKQLGGKLGSSLQSDLGVNTVGDLLQFSEDKLQECYGINTGTWLWNIARGISGEEVQGRLLPKSHGSGKTFPGPRALRTTTAVQHWLNQLCEELSERLSSDLDQNKRIARTLTLHARGYKSSDSESHKSFPSKSCPLRYGTAKIQEDAVNLFQAGLREFMESHGVKTQRSPYNGWGITSLSVSASKIVAMPSGTCSIMKYFQGQNMSNSSPANFIRDAAPSSPSGAESGSESFSELNSTEQQTELQGEDAWDKHTVPALGQLEQKTIMWEDQGPGCPSSKQAQGGFTNKASPLLCSGSESCSGPNQSKSERETPGVKNAMFNLERHEQRRNKLKEKVYKHQHGVLNVIQFSKVSNRSEGTASILRFFKSCNSTSSSTMQEQVVAVPDTEEHFSMGNLQSLDVGAGTKSVSDSSTEINEVKAPNESFLAIRETNSSSGYGSGQNEQRRDAWNYNVDEIDPAVIDELPPEIQREIHAWLRPHKRPNTVKQCSTIARYFLPTKKT